MTLYVSNRDGNGKTDEKGHYKFPSNAFAGSVVFPGLQVTQNSPLAMSVIVTKGDFRIATSDDYAYTGWSNTDTVVTTVTSDPANPRIDTVVLYVDKSAATSASPPNNPNVAKFKIVAGTPNAIPSAPNSTTIQSSVGAGNPYIILANISIAAGSTTIANGAITDLRSRVTIADNFVSETSILDSAVSTNKLLNSAVTTAKVADANITTAKLANAAVTTAKFRPSIINSNFTVGARYNVASAGAYPIPGCSLTYTAGGTNETLFIWTSVMASKSGGGSAEVFLYVNGAQYGTSMYSESGISWPRMECLNVIDVAANSSTTLAVWVVNNNATNMSITTDQARWIPTIKGFSIYRP